MLTREKCGSWQAHLFVHYSGLAGSFTLRGWRHSCAGKYLVSASLKKSVHVYTELGRDTQKHTINSVFYQTDVTEIKIIGV